MKLILTAFLFSISLVSLSAQDFEKVTYEGKEYYLLPNDFEPHKTAMTEQYPNYINNFQLPDGMWISFLPSMPDKPYVIGEYRNGLATGTWRSYSIDWDDTTSFVFLVTQYKDGKRNGEQLYYNEPGVLSQKINFMDDEYHGDFISYNALGVTLVDGQYQYGIPVGKWEFHNHDGVKMRIESYKDNITPDSVAFYKDRTLYDFPETRNVDVMFPKPIREEMEYIPSAEGVWTEYDRDGIMTFEKTYSHGRMVYVKEYYPNGKVKEEGPTVSARDYSTYPVKRSYDPDVPEPFIKTGTWYYYDESGNEVKTELYKNGMHYRGEDFYKVPD